MDFRQIDIYTKSGAADALVYELTELGVSGFVMHDSEDFEEFINDKNANWDYIDDSLSELSNTPTFLTFYLPDNSQGQEKYYEITELLNRLRAEEKDFYGDLRIKTGNVREEDWENCWKEYYKPFRVGKRLIIKPTWENVDTKMGDIILEIDPASAFGTGQHATTRLCLEALEEFIYSSASVLDLGCGSGILSIASLLLGAERITAVDIMENAVKTTSDNIELNGFNTDKFSALCGDVIKDEEFRKQFKDFDIVTANIVADVIIAMSGFIGGFVKPNGIIVFSGVISERLPEVVTALKKGGLDIKETRETEGWNAIICRHI